MNNVLVVSNFNAGRKKALKYRKTLQKFLLKNAKSFKFVSVDEIEPQLFLLFDSVIVMGGDGKSGSQTMDIMSLKFAVDLVDKLSE